MLHGFAAAEAIELDSCRISTVVRKRGVERWGVSLYCLVPHCAVLFEKSPICGSRRYALIRGIPVIRDQSVINFH
jgi:hypothetical protein